MTRSDDSDDERWLVMDGRRWRRTDPAVREAELARLKSHLGRGRSGVRTALDAGLVSAEARSCPP